MGKYYKTDSNASSGGLGILSVLQIIFIVLKVLDLISWSWWVVFIPTFIGLGLTVLALFILFVAALIPYIKTKKKMKH